MLILVIAAAHRARILLAPHRAKEAAGAVGGNESLKQEGEAQQDKAAAQRDVAAKEAEAEKARAEASAAEAEQRSHQ